MIVAVAVGGAAGALIRAAGLAAFPTAAEGFPWATLVENVTGAFLLGALLTMLVHRWPTTRYARPLLGTGLLGAYTTFSSFVVELGLLLASRSWAVAGLYATATVVVGLGAASLGVAAGGRWPLARAPQAGRQP